MTTGDGDRSWFHRSGTPGWPGRSLLWFGQSVAATAVVYVALGTLAAGLLGGLVSAMLLFRQVDGMVQAS